ncbi:unnamed protein product [Taenia asiatica]|uniref:Cytochrome b5 heme-binding domain-containing protein n=1 Tax=Taenia asiatica TaxID=60517 RepID=A0A3P6RMR0_TAEAS|nr:unnamed protein product [Taenia asiatica]
MYVCCSLLYCLPLINHFVLVEVFDVTPFAEYHPGGADVIAQYAGTDATEAFRCAHAYISPYMIHRLKKGHLVSSSRLQRSPNCKFQIIPTESFLVLSPIMSLMPVQLPPVRDLPPARPKWDWTTLPDECLVTFEIALRRPLASVRPSSHLIATTNLEKTDLQRKILQVFIMLDKEYYVLKLRLLPQLKAMLHSIRFDRQFSYFSVDPHVHLDLKFPQKLSSGSQLSTLGSVLQDELVSFSEAFERVGFMKCEIVFSERLGESPYRLLRLQWLMEEAHMPIPLLHHVLLCVKDANDLVHVRPYTPTCPNLSPEGEKSSDPSKFDILVKVYPNGTVSGFLDNAVKGSVVKVSLPQCQLSASILLNRFGDVFRPWSSVCMLCGGSGITPFLPLIQYLLALRESRLHLLWFNQREKDLILRSQLDDLAASSDARLQVHYWLMEPEERIMTCRQPNVTIGGIDDVKSPKSFDTFLNTPATSLLCLICGPQGFNSAASALAQAWGIPGSNVHIL